MCAGDDMVRCVRLAEELLLLALDPVKGSVVNSAYWSLRVGLSGALVAELGLAGSVTLVGRRFEVTGPLPEHPVLAAAGRSLRERGGRRSADQVRRLDRGVGGVWQSLTDGLVAQGVLGRRRDRVFLVPVTRHPVLRLPIQQEIVARLRAAAAGDGPLDPQTSVVLALAGPCRLLEVVAPERVGRRHAKQRIEEAAARTPAAPAVQQVLREVQTAAAAAAAVAAGAAGGS